MFVSKQFIGCAFLISLSLMMIGCESERIAPTSTRLMPTLTEHSTAPLPTLTIATNTPDPYPPPSPISSPAYPPPGSTQIPLPTLTPSPIPPTVATITPASAAVWVPLLDGYFNPSSELPPVSPPPWEKGMDRQAFIRSYVRTVTELVNWVNGDAAAYVSQVQAWTSVNEEPIPAQIWFEMTDMDGDGNEEIITSFPIIYEAQLNGPGTPLETYVMCGPSLCLGQVLLFEQLEDMYLPVYRFGYNQNWEWLSMPQLVTIRDLNDDGLPEIAMTESWCGASVCGKDLTISQWDGERLRFLDSGKCPSEFMAVNSTGNGQSEFHIYCPELEPDMVNDETN